MSGPTLFQKGKLEAHKYSPSKAELDQIVPIDYIMNWFSKRLKSSNNPLDRIMVLKSSTGSGKSTVIPPEFYHRFFDETHRRNICCTQPRVLTSIEIPKTILPFHTASFLKTIGKTNRKPLIMGDNIGFQNSVISKRPIRGIIYMTVGTLQQQLNIMSDEDFMRRYSLIVIDEAHERSIGTDFTLYMMKKFIMRNYKNPECPFLLVTSATFNTHKFADYLLSSEPKTKRYENIINVGGFTFPITETWPKYDSDNYIQDAVSCAIKIHKENKNDFLPPSEVVGTIKSLKTKEDKLSELRESQVFRDILIFISGESDAKKIIQKLTEANSRDKELSKYPIVPIKLMGIDVSAKTENYKNITKPMSQIGVEIADGKKVSIKHPVRRIIVATNVAETGITIDTLKYVIDTGYLKSSEFNPVYQVGMLVTSPVTQGMYTQRRGRSGRKAPGFAFPLYTKETFDSLQVDQFPDIVRGDICLDLLGLIIKECDQDGRYNEEPLVKLLADTEYTDKIYKTNINLYNLDLLDVPSVDSLHGSLDRLYRLGAITRASTPTLLGFIINKFRFMSVESIKMILAGFAWDISIIDLITIASYIGVTDKQDFFMRGKRRDDNPFQDAIDRGDFKFPWFLPNHYRTELLLSCDFIWGLLVWYNYQNVVSSSVDKSTDISLQDWCESVGVNYRSLNEMVESRDEILQMMASIGLNPYKSFDKSFRYIESSELHNWVSGIKQCIFEGYKTNIAVWDSSKNVYTTKLGRLQITPERTWLMSSIKSQEYGVNNPKYIIYSGVRLRQDTRTNTYVTDVKHISAMDGYVPIDVEF